jgi:hypothetical protein
MRLWNMQRRALLVWPAFSWMRGADFVGMDRAVAERLLTESAWAREVRVPFRQAFAAQGRSGSVGTEIHLTVRWGSALPVRQANASLLGVETRAAKKLLATEPAEYVLEVAGFPAAVLRDGKAAEKELAATAVLTGKGRKTWKAVSAMVPEFGTHLMAEIRFQRDPAIGLAEGEVEFAASALGGAMRIRAKFPLKEMVYEGRLEL